MQKSTFTSGGFVLHNIRHLSKNRISAWFDVDGNLLDAEYITANFQSRKIATSHKDIRDRLQTIGKVWKTK